MQAPARAAEHSAKVRIHLAPATSGARSYSGWSAGQGHASGARGLDRSDVDLNLATLYQGNLQPLITSGDYKGARDLVARIIRYSPNQAGAHMNYGLLSYLAGDKDTAVSELKKALELNPNLRAQLESVAKARPQYQLILRDEEFLKRIW